MKWLSFFWKLYYKEDRCHNHWIDRTYEHIRKALFPVLSVLTVAVSLDQLGDALFGPSLAEQLTLVEEIYDTEYILHIDIFSNMTKAYVKGEELIELFSIQHTDGKGKGPKEKYGDKKTPWGVYRISHYNEGRPTINYPNSYDTQLKRTGGGIRLLNVDSYGNRRKTLESIFLGEDVTNGMIVYTNEDYTTLLSFLEHDPRLIIGYPPSIYFEEKIE